MKRKLTNKPFWSLLLICVLFALWILIIPPIIGFVLLIKFCVEMRTIRKQQADLEKEKAKIDEIDKSFNEANFQDLVKKIIDLQDKFKAQSLENDAKLKKQIGKIQKSALLYNSIKAYVEAFGGSEISNREMQKIDQMIQELDIEDLMNPTVEIKLHNTDIRDLRKQYREIDKNIDIVLNDFEKRYTTKANLAIYRLMVVALRSELQNVLYTMKFGKLEDAEAAISEIADKYIKIAADGNQSIAPTITKFVTQTKSLFIDAARVEYEYYMRRERIKEEQKALRDQMRQEAEERRRLEEEQKKIEQEESKYTNEMEKLQEQMKYATDEKSKQLSDRIAELEAMLNHVNEKKEIIAKLQNGKAGYVYVISNLGSFGERVFKIGMTRRREPQERIDELGDASVPFGFDVHSFIFSNDAPALETAIHHKLNDRRVNKVNLRKEFFDISIDELEELVYQLEPSAEFNRTMAAEQYRQSLSMKESFVSFDNDIDDEEFVL